MGRRIGEIPQSHKILFRPLCKSSGGQFLSLSPHFPSVKHSVLRQEAVNALTPPLDLRASMQILHPPRRFSTHWELLRVIVTITITTSETNGSTYSSRLWSLEFNLTEVETHWYSPRDDNWGRWAPPRHSSGRSLTLEAVHKQIVLKLRHRVTRAVQRPPRSPADHREPLHGHPALDPGGVSMCSLHSVSEPRKEIPFICFFTTLPVFCPSIKLEEPDFPLTPSRAEVQRVVWPFIPQASPGH
ncbi:hypothetical protein EVAR_36633_1 [Eumeta japonica]|uniref:Uncharacterized protein n=1 Tax=Eumeta variegata TaxID=151549 RepID=A0A4C1YR22_EUMVA|nr:hypothetical protein EVAR_36633_1 [Eumeta japonica]